MHVLSHYASPCKREDLRAFHALHAGSRCDEASYLPLPTRLAD